jgi:hypothetical protein
MTRSNSNPTQSALDLVAWLVRHLAESHRRPWSVDRGPTKREQRQIKRELKRAGSQRRHRQCKRDLRENPEEAPDSEVAFGRYSTAELDAIDRENTGRRG